MCGRSVQASAKTDVTDWGCTIALCFTMWFGQLVEYSHPLSKRKKQNNSSLFAPNVKVRPLQQNWKPTGCHRAQTFERHKVHVSRRGIYKKQKHIETQVRAIKRVNRDHIQSTCFTHFFYCFFCQSLSKTLSEGETFRETHSQILTNIQYSTYNQS